MCIRDRRQPNLADWTPPPLNIDGIDVDVTVEEIKTFETTIKNDEVAAVNLEDYEGKIKVIWQGEGLELILIYPEGSDYKIKRWALKPLGSSCGENFEELSSLEKEIIVPSGTGKKILRIRPLCNQATVKISSDSPLPPQFYKIRAEAAGPGGETRAVEVTRSLPILPPIFDYVLFSGGGLVK